MRTRSSLFEAAKSAFGDIAAVVNSAGIMTLAPIRAGDIDGFDNVIATNLRGTYLVMSEAANHVVDGGRIIVFSTSVLGRVFRPMAPTPPRRPASKRSRVLANELALAPDHRQCGGGGAGRDRHVFERQERRADCGDCQNGTARPIGEVDDIVGVVSFLLGRDGGWVTGESSASMEAMREREGVAKTSRAPGLKSLFPRGLLSMSSRLIPLPDHFECANVVAAI